MKTERIVISDTNIFFDLMSIDLLQSFFELPYTIETTDFVISEIEQSEQVLKVTKFIKNKKLLVHKSAPETFNKILTLHNICGTNASIPDCSVWFYAKTLQARLLTGDNKLRKIAEKDGITVSGVLFIFDKLVEYGILQKKDASIKLQNLLFINHRLPLGECEKRIEQWQKN